VADPVVVVSVLGIWCSLLGVDGTAAPCAASPCLAVTGA